MITCLPNFHEEIKSKAVAIFAPDRLVGIAASLSCGLGLDSEM